MVTERLFTDHAMTPSSGAWERPSPADYKRWISAWRWCRCVEGEIYTRQQLGAVHRHCITKLLVTNVSTPASSTMLHTILHPAPSTIPTTPHSPQQSSPPTRHRHRLNSLEAAVRPFPSLTPRPAHTKRLVTPPTAPSAILGPRASSLLSTFTAAA
jgi:hypothetical protein